MYVSKNPLKWSQTSTPVLRALKCRCGKICWSQLSRWLRNFDSSLVVLRKTLILFMFVHPGMKLLHRQ